MRVVVNTIPKSGTYLYARMLERLGFVNLGVHLSSSFAFDFRQASADEIIADGSSYRVPIPIAETATWIEDGQFAVGHIDYSPSCAALLDDFVHIFCVRDLRNVMLSFMRFSLDPRRKDRPNMETLAGLTGAEQFARFLETSFAREYLSDRIVPILDWMGRANLTVRFEDISGANGRDASLACATSIFEVLKVKSPPQPDEILAATLHQPTRTYSGVLSDYRSVWTEEVDELFAALNGPALNAKLGY